ncbi:aldo/keto reductase family oxidoreductase [Streptococcus pneumoniae]|nr:aldo/keto reductase family oxidoreductase [Streptococcus pneumoniae]
MRYITLGQDDKELSEIVLGMMRIKDKSVKEVEELVETALSVGINAFDLADIYGRATWLIFMVVVVVKNC